MHIYFGLDYTLVDNSGSYLRPCIKELLNSFKDNGIIISLWTSSTEERTYRILKEQEVNDYFTNLICKDQFDSMLEGHPKDIGKYEGGFLVDDDPDQIEFVRSTGKEGFQISPLMKGELEYLSELKELHKIILPDVEFAISKDGLKGCGCLTD